MRGWSRSKKPGRTYTYSLTREETRRVRGTKFAKLNFDRLTAIQFAGLKRFLKAARQEGNVVPR